MKKILLSVLALGMSFGAIAQTNASLAENLPTASGEGFEFKFLSPGTNDPEKLNCLYNAIDGSADGQPGVSAHWGFTDPAAAGYNAAGYRFSIDATSHELIVDFNGSQGYTLCRLPKGNCAYPDNSLLDMSIQRKVEVDIKSSVDATFSIFMCTLDGTNLREVDGDASNPAPSIALNAGDHKIFCQNAPTVNWQGTDYSASFADVIGFGIKVTSTTAGQIKIAGLRFGDAATLTAGTTSTTDATALDANLISVYPTPAKEVLNVDLSKIGAAELKLVSSNGQTVYSSSAFSSVEVINVESFNKGLYVLQITSNGKTATKKVVLN